MPLCFFQEENVSEVVDEIVQSWVNFTKSSQAKQVEVVDKLNVESMRIKDIIEQQQSKVVQTGKNKLVDSEFKKKLLEQYAAVSDEERYVGKRTNLPFENEWPRYYG